MTGPGRSTLGLLLAMVAAVTIVAGMAVGTDRPLPVLVESVGASDVAAADQGSTDPTGTDIVMDSADALAAITSADAGASGPAGAAGAPTPDPANRIHPLPPAPGLPPPTATGPAPVGLHIPALGVTAAPVIAVGVEPDGQLSVPPATEVGWYRFGSRPGDDGSSVLAAHIAYNGVDGVFRGLAALEVGALVAVVLEDGSTLRYRIDEVVDFDKADLPTDDLFDEAGSDRLVLITCGGDFNPNLRSYDSNTVAFASPV